LLSYLDGRAGRKAAKQDIPEVMAASLFSKADSGKRQVLAAYRVWSEAMMMMSV